jgi:mono/diheme cytochrome c family protein
MAGIRSVLPVPPWLSAVPEGASRRLGEGGIATRKRRGTCAGCHGINGKGTAVDSDLTSGKWLWGNGSVRAITRTIIHGVPKPKNHTGAMPPTGGVQLSRADLAAVADNVWAMGHRNTH